MTKLNFSIMSPNSIKIKNENLHLMFKYGLTTHHHDLNFNS